MFEAEFEVLCGSLEVEEKSVNHSFGAIEIGPRLVYHFHLPSPLDSSLPISVQIRWIRSHDLLTPEILILSYYPHTRILRFQLPPIRSLIVHRTLLNSPQVKVLQSHALVDLNLEIS